MIRRIVTIVLTITIVLNIFSINSMAETTNNGNFYIQYDGQIYRYKNRFVKLVMDGNVIKTGDMPAVIITENIDGEKVARTLVPVREVCESEQIGASVDWNGEKQEIYISYEDKFIVLKVNDRKAIVNNKEVILDIPAKLIQNVGTKKWKTMVPIRFIVETFGYEVNWNGKDYCAEMTKQSNSEENDAIKDDENGDEQTDIEDKNDDNSDIDNEEKHDNDNDTEKDTDTDDKINNDNTDKDDTSSDKEDDTDKDNSSDKDDSESLDSLESGGAKNELPTELKDNPVVWTVDDDILSQVNDRYTESSVVRKLCPTTNIEKVEYIDDKINKKFVIKATSPITDIKKSLWENKLIIDIDNSKCNMKDEIAFEDNTIISGVRTSQFEDNITRIVFDLHDPGNRFNIGLSEDRKEVNIVIQENSIYSIHLGQNDKGDFIKILGIKAPDVKTFRLSNPDRIIFDLPNTMSLLSTLSSSAKGQYIKEIRTAQFDTTTTRIVVETDGQADYNIFKDSESATMIQFIEPSYDNINYENYDRPTLILNKQDKKIEISKIKCVDDYINRKYIINLPENYKELFGSGTIRINDGIFNSVDIDNNNEGNTVLTINENTIYDYRITEDEDNIYIKAYKPKELYSQVIVIDPGHGDTDPGATGNGIAEKDVNLDITLFLKEYLDKDNNIKTYYSRTTDIYSSLGDRCDIANEVDCDFFVSIHNNSFKSGANGTEVYYLAPSSKPGMTSQKLADIFLKKIIDAAGTKNRGCKTANYYVLRNTDMPAILLEIAFISNAEDAAKLKSDKFKKNVAHSIYESILESFNKFPTGR
ncbi:hypothetical protein SH1V18_06110 [Vallitalea longa]|uniref:MurNAc-LAA domain-containing protein n=1 Tax=Vallitalea longa TaxID=2936439 RepID=A0A9W5Y8S4_9FIRM|nr:N-acetylmuramoyl-L-alanine amidase [Vallitalea longa]GKX28131.1 hypothetical protein SH1V18_06110 [Vallitalea longa]